jgi:hypothetical protein
MQIYAACLIQENRRMPLFWYLAGALSTLAALIVLLPWLRNLSGLNALLLRRGSAPIAAVLLIAAILASYHWLSQPQVASPSSVAAPAHSSGAFSDAVKAFADAGESTASSGAPKPAASSMESAVAALEGRLAKGGGSPDDWELLAKSYEFLGRPADAAAARAHQLPKSTAAESTAAAGTGTAAATGAGSTISGEVMIAAPLSAKAAAGDTLFIVAKSISSPGVPVAVFRGAVGTWPMKFTLSDAQSMLPGRNLSSAGRVVVEARVSLKGQPLPASGDLQGTSGEIDPADKRPLKIIIDRVIP